MFSLKRPIKIEKTVNVNVMPGNICPAISMFSLLLSVSFYHIYNHSILLLVSILFKRRSRNKEEDCNSQVSSCQPILQTVFNLNFDYQFDKQAYHWAP
ncbi:unnamed protein product [Rotaria socialis]